MPWNDKDRAKYDIPWTERTDEQKHLYNQNQKEKAAAKAIAEGREPYRVGRPPVLTPEEREANRKAQNQKRSLRARQRRKEQRAAKAIAQGREPGLVGVRSKLSPEERKARRREIHAAYRAANIEEIRQKDVERQRAIRQARKEGKIPPPVPGQRGPIPFRTEEERKLRGIKDSHNRRARIRDNGGTHTVSDILALHAKQNGICPFCIKSLDDGTEVHVDHWVPLVLGGSNGPDNLRLLHSTCNLRKGANHPSTFGLAE